MEGGGLERILGITHLSLTHIHTGTHNSLTNLQSEIAFRFLSLDKDPTVFSGCLNLEAGWMLANDQFQFKFFSPLTVILQENLC